MLLTMSTSRTQALARCERRYRDLAQKLAAVGYIASGSLAHRPSRCGKPSCACNDDPPRLHGPYWHFTAKVDGKTVNKRLSEHEAALYNEWIANDRRVRELLSEMRSVASEAQALILADQVGEPDERTGQGRHDTSPQPGPTPPPPRS